MSNEGYGGTRSWYLCKRFASNRSKFTDAGPMHDQATTNFGEHICTVLYISDQHNWGGEVLRCTYTFVLITVQPFPTLKKQLHGLMLQPHPHFLPFVTAFERTKAVVISCDIGTGEKVFSNTSYSHYKLLLLLKSLYS